MLAEYTFKTDSQKKYGKSDKRKFYDRGKAYMKATYGEEWERMYFVDLLNLGNELDEKHNELKEQGEDYLADTVWGAIKVCEDVIQYRRKGLKN